MLIKLCMYTYLPIHTCIVIYSDLGLGATYTGDCGDGDCIREPRKCSGYILASERQEG